MSDRTRRQADPSANNDPEATRQPETADITPRPGRVGGRGHLDIDRQRDSTTSDSVEHVADISGDVERE